MIFRFLLFCAAEKATQNVQQSAFSAQLLESKEKINDSLYIFGGEI